MIKRLFLISFLSLTLLACNESDSANGPTDGDHETSIDGDADCQAGTLDCVCYGNGTCNEGLECVQNRCKSFDSGEDGDLDSSERENIIDGDSDAEIESELSDLAEDDLSDTSEDDLDAEKRDFDEEAPMDGDEEEHSSDGDQEYDIEEDLSDHDLFELDEDRDENGLTDGDMTEVEEESGEVNSETEQEEAEHEVEEEILPECDNGPCCNAGQWVEVNQPCLAEWDNLDCTGDQCNASHECVHPLLAGFCLIEGVCYIDEADNPDDTCQMCDADSNDWEAKPLSASCSDGDPCTYGDYCWHGGECKSGGFYGCAPTECQESNVCDGEGGCSIVDMPNDTACGEEDGFCTGPNTCQDGVCERTWAISCNGHGSCLPESGECQCLDSFAGSNCGTCAEDAPGIYPNCQNLVWAQWGQTMWPVSPSGQRACYNEWYTIDCPGNAGSVACSTIGFCGQDAQYSEVPRAILESGTVNQPTMIDSLTGFMWQAGEAGEDLTWQEAKDYCDDLIYAGYSDWRLPNPHEWISLFDFGRILPSLSADVFPDTPLNHYWTYEKVETDYSRAWYVATNYGLISQSPLDSGTLQVGARCIRDHAEWNEGGNAYRFIEEEYPHGQVYESVVRDMATGLMWEREDDSSVSFRTWLEALSYCESAETGAFTDWRLPNIKELLSLVNYSGVNVVWDGIHEGVALMTETAYWSSTTSYSTPYRAHTVHFGTDKKALIYKTDFARVRCVR